ncbi:MAG: M23 family metallopeptidase [Clostridia bacterium]|nr:M23 family metallopeptidase [Clostridia bacterium]
MQDKEVKEKKIQTKKKLNGEKRFYLATAIGCAVMLVAIVVTAVIVSGTSSDAVLDNTPNSGNSSVLPEGDVGDEQVSALPEGMVVPIQTASVSNTYGFYYNKTLDSYYVHTGVDFVADAGTEVMAVEDGVVESVYKEDVLLGTQIVVRHAEGLKSVYRFVNEVEGLQVGDKVEKGDVIATVAEANGNEYKDGAHLHFTIEKNGKTVDPTQYLTLEEK